MKVTALLNTQSAARKNSAAAIDIMRTAAVVTTVSLRVGQVTLDDLGPHLLQKLEGIYHFHS